MTKTMRYHRAIAVLVFILFSTGAVLTAHADIRALSAAKAHELAKKGEIVLVDIRSPEEWRQTSIGTSALAISMHRPGFLSKLSAAVNGDKSRPVALICAAGQRSAYIARLLSAQGYREVIDVAEGMLGSRAGPGWLRHGLPVRSVPGQ